MAAHRFDELDEGEHPTLYRLRAKIAAAGSDTQFRRGLSRLLDSSIPKRS
jgi:hypothetical protein